MLVMLFIFLILMMLGAYITVMPAYEGTYEHVVAVIIWVPFIIYVFLITFVGG